MTFHKRVIDILTKMAEANPSNFKLACAITWRKSILAFGMNSYKTDPFQAKFANKESKIYKHAEIDAIKRVKNRYGEDIFPECTLYIIRLRKPHKKSKEYIRGMARPCSGCMKAIQKYKIKKVVYTTDYWIEEI